MFDSEYLKIYFQPTEFCYHQTYHNPTNSTSRVCLNIRKKRSMRLITLYRYSSSFLNECNFMK